MSVEEDSRQEWTFTLYDFDNNGKVTREVSAPAWAPRPRALELPPCARPLLFLPLVLWGQGFGELQGGREGCPGAAGRVGRGD